MIKNVFKAVAAFFIIVCITQTSNARIIAILHDDSGSMTGKDMLPAFGAQLLISTLDGDTGEDTLITALMSDVYNFKNSPDKWIKTQDISATQLQQKLNDEIKNTWVSINRSPTPHIQLELLLEKITQIQKKDEEAFLIILADGVFADSDREPRIPELSTFIRKISQISDKLKGPLRTEFILMAPEQVETSSGKTVGQLSNEQGFRDALLRLTNGDANIGSINVNSTKDLLEAIKNVISRVSATEQDGLNAYITENNNTVTIDAPLAVKRIVSVSLVDKNNAADPSSIASTSFSPTRQFEVHSEMARADTNTRWQGEIWKGRTTHFLFDPPLPAGSHEINFTGRNDDNLLLFQSAADLKLKILDENGNVISPISDGKYVIPQNSLVTLSAEIFDGDVTVQSVVPMDRFKSGADVIASVTSTSSTESLKLETTSDNLSSQTQITTNELGIFEIQAILKAKGFVSTYSKPISIEIVDINAELSAEIASISQCTQCGNDELGIVLAPGEDLRRVASLKISAQIPIDEGKLEISLEESLGPIRILDSGLQTKIENLTVDEGSNSLEFDLMLEGDSLDLLLSKTDMEIQVTVKAMQGMIGSATTSRKLKIFPADIDLISVGNTQYPDDRRPLKLNIGQMHEKDHSLNFRLVNAFSKNSTVEDFSIESSRPFIDYEIELQGEYLSVTPVSNFPCGCFIHLFANRKIDIDLIYKPSHGLQSTSISKSFNIDSPFKYEGMVECLKLLGSILLFIYLVISIMAFLRAIRFPKDSCFQVTINKDDPTFSALRGWNFTIIKALLWPIFGVPHEQTSKEGVHLIARRNGAIINLQKSNSDILIDSLGDKISTLLEENPNMRFYKISWGDGLEIRSHRESIKISILASASDS